MLSAFLRKEASRLGDVGMGALSGIPVGVGEVVTGIPFGGGLNTGAYVAGLLNAPDDPKKVSDFNWSRLAPGVVTYKQSAIEKALANDYEKRTGKSSNFWPSTIGQFTGTALGTAVGGGIGAGLGAILGKGSGSVVRGAGIGAGTGLGLSLLAPAVLALLTETRIRKEQDAAEGSAAKTVTSLAVPGVGVYEHFKRLGRAYAERGEGMMEDSKIPKKAESHPLDPGVLLDLKNAIKGFSTTNTVASGNYANTNLSEPWSIVRANGSRTPLFIGDKIPQAGSYIPPSARRVEMAKSKAAVPSAVPAAPEETPKAAASSALNIQAIKDFMKSHAAELAGAGVGGAGAAGVTAALGRPWYETAGAGALGAGAGYGAGMGIKALMGKTV